MSWWHRGFTWKTRSSLTKEKTPMKLASVFCIPGPLPVHSRIKGRQVHPLIRFYAEEPRRVPGSDGSRLWHGDITSRGNGGYVRNLDVPYLELRVMSWRHRGPMESATSWTPSLPCGMQMLTSECMTDKCHARGCNLPTAPAQIR